MGKRGRRRGRAFQSALRVTAPPRHPRIVELVAEIEAEGWTVVFVPFVEDAETPGVLLGRMAGICIGSKRKIKIALTDPSRPDQLARPRRLIEVLEHEMRHMRGAEHAGDCPELGLQCGGRVNGFGEPVPRKVEA